MPELPTGWRCARCDARNLASAEACRRCGAPQGAMAAVARADSGGLAAALSLLLPGSGHLYTRQVLRAAVIVVLPLALGAGLVATLALFDPLLAGILRVAVAAAGAAVIVLGLYHGVVILDAFAAPSTRGAGLVGKRRADYLALAGVAVVFAVAYASLFQQATAWAALAARVFEPFQSAPARNDDTPAWTSTERLNLLVLGIDTRRGSDTQASRSDTVIVLTLDPQNRAAGMLSIPRDTVVPIPGRGEDKINAAYAFGGAELARRTVSGFLGVPIHAYALIDFEGFRGVVDAVGGVVVDAPLPVRDEAFPTEDFGLTRMHLRAGPQLMDGETALRYARSRHGSDDFSRAERQQRVIGALRQKASENALLLRLPSLVGQVSDAVRTDMDPALAVPLGLLVSQIPTRDIERAVLRPPGPDGPGQLREVNGANGYFLAPLKDAVARLVAELFYDPRVRAEAARVEIRSVGVGSSEARELRDDLARRRYQVVRVETVAEQRRTGVLLLNAQKRYSAERLARALGASLVDGGTQADADVVVLVGDDFRGLSASPPP